MASSGIDQVLRLVSNLARTHHSAALAQLASRISVVFKFGAENGEQEAIRLVLGPYDAVAVFGLCHRSGRMCPTGVSGEVQS